MQGKAMQGKARQATHLLGLQKGVVLALDEAEPVLAASLEKVLFFGQPLDRQLAGKLCPRREKRLGFRDLSPRHGEGQGLGLASNLKPTLGKPR